MSASFDRTWENVTKLTDPSMTPENVQEFYIQWSKVYDEDFTPEFFGGPNLLIDVLQKYIPEAVSDRANLHVMDLCAGTGLVGAKLSQLGFKNIDALDASEAMLQQLKSKNQMYQRIIHDTLGDHQIDVKNDTYDLVTLNAGFVQGHVPVIALEEILRICKPGGLFITTMRVDFLDNVVEYRNKLEPYMKQMENNGKWKLLQRCVGPDFMKGKDGVTFVFRKCVQ